MFKVVELPQVTLIGLVVDPVKLGGGITLIVLIAALVLSHPKGSIPVLLFLTFNITTNNP